MSSPLILTNGLFQGPQKRQSWRPYPGFSPRSNYKRRTKTNKAFKIEILDVSSGILVECQVRYNTLNLMVD